MTLIHTLRSTSALLLTIIDCCCSLSLSATPVFIYISTNQITAMEWWRWSGEDGSYKIRKLININDPRLAPYNLPYCDTVCHASPALG